MLELGSDTITAICTGLMGLAAGYILGMLSASWIDHADRTHRPGKHSQR